jgi:hypothetical protein
MAIEYVRDIPVDSDFKAKEETINHVRDQVAAIADADDDPETRREDVQIELYVSKNDSTLMRVRGYLDAEPKARYLKKDFDPFEGIDEELIEEGAPDGTY